MTVISPAKPGVSDKRTAILEATLELLSECGFHNTPMSMVAKASGVSTCIIYHYFASKEELIIELYKKSKADLLRVGFEGFSDSKSFGERFQNIWFNAIRYHKDHPREAAFLEQFENSPYLKPSLLEAFAGDIERFHDFINQGKDAGALKDLPFEVGVALTFGVAVSLAKQHVTGKIAIVTGANCGIGYEAARALAAGGAQVVMA